MPSKTGTGIIVGRFQTYRLNVEHQRLIDSVVKRHPRVVIFLGTNPAPSELNPLDFKWRSNLFDEDFAGRVEVQEVPDTDDDRIWSQELDRRILELRPEGDVVLYGTREGLIHISELANHRVTHPKEVVKEGDVLQLRVIRIDPARRRMGLSLKRVAEEAYAEYDWRETMDDQVEEDWVEGPEDEE